LPTSGAEKIIADLNRKAQALSPASISGVMSESGKQGVETARTRVRVRTGRLRDSIKWEQQGAESGTIGSDLYYARPQEFGTTRFRGQPYITPGAETVVTAIKEKLGTLLK
jgi:HK97 gp10 family phage protein